MTDMPEKIEKIARHDDVEADFEGHKLDVRSVKSDISDVRSATDDDGADFEGHSLDDMRGMKGVKAVKSVKA